MDLFESLERMGRIKRTGWIMAKIPSDIAESIAEHTLKTIFTAMIICGEFRGLDEYKVLKMALIHDLPEASTSDIPKPIKEKINREDILRVNLEALKEVFGEGEWLKIYLDYCRGEDLEAKIVDLADGIATYIQSINYRFQYGIRTPHLDSIMRDTWRSINEKALNMNLDLNKIVKKLIGREIDFREISNETLI